MNADWVLRGARLIDGSGSPARRADVAIAGDRVVATGTIPASDGARSIDLDGLVLAPGFVDPHTHYDAQIFWDADVTSSSWHGVTSVVMGNCGLSLAPTRPHDRPAAIRTLASVEAMPIPALEAGIDWTFETYPQFLAALDARPKRINVGGLVGHTALRTYVLQDGADERPATDAEIAQMRALLRDAVTAGALGFSTSHSRAHVGHDGRPVASRASSVEEIVEICRALTGAGRGIIEVAQDPSFGIREMSSVSVGTGRPITFAVVTGLRGPAPAALDFIGDAQQAPGTLWPQVAPRPITTLVTVDEPFTLAFVNPAFGEAMGMTAEERRALYRDPAWRARAREQLVPGWSRCIDTAVVEESGAHRALRNGPTLHELACARGTAPMDVLVDLALEDDARTVFRLNMFNDDEDELGHMLRNEHCMLGLGDGGAHLDVLCDAVYPTYLLRRWVRELGILTLEEAVWRLSGQPAARLGLVGRGLVRPGYYADLVAFDPDTVTDLPLEKVHDLPTGARRLIGRSRGIEHVWVNGQPIRAHGADVDGASPGMVLRGGPNSTGEFAP